MWVLLPQQTPVSIPTTPSKEDDMNTITTASYPVTGMSCDHCVGAVTEELTALPGVTGMSVDLVAGGTSTVTITSDTPIDTDQVYAALHEAGNYQLATD
jgi:copper chaperone